MKKWIVGLLAIALIGGAWYFLKKEKPEVIIEPIAKEVTFDLEELLTINEEDQLYNDHNLLVVKKGNASVTRADGTVDEVATETEVEAGDSIVMAGGSEAEIQWFEGSVSRLSGETDIRIERADYNEENISQTNISIFAKVGTIWSKVVSLVDGESDYSILSASAIAGVRGSAFNYIKERDKDPIIESYEHSAFLATLDENKEIKEEIIIISGQKVKFEDAKPKIEEITEEEKDATWIAQNRLEDQGVERTLKEKNFKTITALAGPLPTDPDYDKKNEFFDKKLAEAIDPHERAELEAKIVKIRVYESIASGKVTSLTEQMGELAEKLEASEMPEDVKEQVRSNFKNGLKVMDRAMEDVLPDEPGRYEVKEVIRTEHIRWESDEEKQKHAEEKAALHKLFEINELADKPGINPELLEEQMDKYHDQIEGLKDRLETMEEFTQIHHQMLDKMLDKPVSIEKIEEMKNQFEDNRPGPNTEEKEPEPEPAKTTAPAPKPTPEPKTTIIKEAPFHQGESVHEPPEEESKDPSPTREPKETIIEEAPFHQGESPL